MTNMQKRIILSLLVVGLLVLSGFLIWEQQRATLVVKNATTGNPMGGMGMMGQGGGQDHSIQAHMMELAEDPNNAHALIALGQAFFQEQKWDNALQFLQRASIVTPNDPNVLYMLAFTQAQKQMYPEAEANFIKFTEITKDPVGYMSLGVLYESFMNKKELAIEAFKKVLASPNLDPTMKKEAEQQLEHIAHPKK